MLWALVVGCASRSRIPATAPGAFVTEDLWPSSECSTSTIHSVKVDGPVLTVAGLAFTTPPGWTLTSLGPAGARLATETGIIELVVTPLCERYDTAAVLTRLARGRFNATAADVAEATEGARVALGGSVGRSLIMRDLVFGGVPQFFAATDVGASESTEVHTTALCSDCEATYWAWLEAGTQP